MPDIYQELWDIDQRTDGIRAITPDTEITPELEASGYVFVDERRDATSEHKVLTNVVIPEAKMESYNRVITLFDNYALDQTKPEFDAPNEAEEVRTFINAIMDKPVMVRAREYIAEGTGRTITANEWWSILHQIWFEEFSMGSNPNLSGFEHVVVGEQKQGKVQGYHFWYKYYLDENFRFDADDAPDTEYDSIKFMNWKNRADDDTPDCVTLGYEWQAFDYQRRVFRKLIKPVGGFWVGPSIIGLLAIGTVRFYPNSGSPRKAVINDHTYNLVTHPGSTSKNIRTFYPEYTGRARGE